MSDAKSITEEQKARIQSWADEGDDLSAIQKKLADELDITVTYMEVRFLMGDLGITMPAKEKPEEEDVSESSISDEDADAITPESGSEEGDLDAFESESSASSEPDPTQEIGGASAVKVTMSDVLPPGALAGGSVTFSDGVHATWSLNQMGQLALDGADPGYRPSEADLQSFQVELQKLAQEKGM